MQLAIAHRALQLLEVFPCQQMGGIDLKCAFELRLGLGESAQFGKRTAEVCMCVGIVWPDANGGCELLRGSWEVSRRGQCICQVVVRIKIFGRSSRRGLQRRQRAIRLSRSNQGSAERIIGGSILRTNTQRLLVLSNRLGSIAACLQHGRKIVVRCKIRRIVPDIVSRESLLQQHSRVACLWIKVARQHLEPEMRHFIL